MTNKNVFDTVDIHDLPESVRNKILNKKTESYYQLLELFKLKSKLSITEIIVGLYRLFGIEKSKVKVNNNLKYLINQKIIKKNRDGSGWSLI